MVYKVDVEKDSHGTRKENRQQETAAGNTKAEKKNKKKSKHQSSSSTSSKSIGSSGSSSSSNSSNKKKRSKKNKKSARKTPDYANTYGGKKRDRNNLEVDEKQQEKARKEAERARIKQDAADKRVAEAEAKKAKDKALRNANRAIAKLSSVQLTLSTNLSSKYIKFVPTFAVDQAKVCQQAVHEVMSAARKLVQKKQGGFNWEPADIGQALAVTEVYTSHHPQTCIINQRLVALPCIQPATCRFHFFPTSSSTNVCRTWTCFCEPHRWQRMQ